ncbi:hypothetical protein [Geminicoccus roseus]|uniref:hypothetical protein n=1 Tax=Geminicoccus roseus TaxID=404900 RepID=UPI000408184D|nr:hypothetical protein [Geminicoccus roseus]
MSGSMSFRGRGLTARIRAAASCLGLAACLGVLAMAPAKASHQPATPKFKIFYQMSWANGTTAKAPTAEQLRACGIETVPLITESVIFGSSMPRYHEPLDLAGARMKYATDKIAAATPPAKLVVLNVEKQGWMIQRGDPQAARKSEQYATLIAHFRRQPAIRAKGTLLGYFGEAPINDYFGYIAGRSQVPSTMQTNSFTRKIAQNADVLFPQMYTRYRESGSKGWIARAEGIMRLIREDWQPAIGRKPVYAYLWPQYHDYASDPAIRKKLLDKGVFATQLATLQRLGADGAVIWGTLGADGSGFKRARWEKDMDWWVETKAFIRANGYPACSIR